MGANHLIREPPAVEGDCGKKLAEGLGQHWPEPPPNPGLFHPVASLTLPRFEVLRGKKNLSTNFP